jgi:hypothetical protein
MYNNIPQNESNSNKPVQHQNYSYALKTEAVKAV